MGKKKRSKLTDADNTDVVGNYFSKPNQSIDFIHTGSTQLDCVLGGGWAGKRIINIIGDRSSGKTLLCIEAMANFNIQYEECNIWYNEVEAAFDPEYAQHLGMPINKVDFIEGCFTVENLFDDLSEKIELTRETDTPGLYIIDSLDALSDRAEQDRDISQNTMGAQKAKKLSELFRKLVKRLESSNITVIIVSQVRDNIGVTFGRKTTRSGGRALDFYASQIIYLAQIKRILKTRKKITRPIGIEIRIKCDKNKVGLPFRECDIQIMFGYGIDDIVSCIYWLDSINQTDSLDYMVTSKKVNGMIKEINKFDDSQYNEIKEFISNKTKEMWYEIESEFLPTRSKY